MRYFTLAVLSLESPWILAAHALQRVATMFRKRAVRVFVSAFVALLPATPSIASAEEASVVATGCTNVVIDATGSAGDPCPPAPAPAPRPERRRWYGWQTLVTDGAAVLFLGAIGGAGESSENALAMASMGTYLLGGPIVHAAHGSGSKAAGSLGLRLGAPLVGAATGFALGTVASDRDREPYTALLLGGLGFIGGIVSASVIDSAVLGHEVVRDAPAPNATPAAGDTSRAPSFRVSPSLGATSRGATVGAIGTF